MDPRIEFTVPKHFDFKAEESDTSELEKWFFEDHDYTQP